VAESDFLWLIDTIVRYHEIAFYLECSWSVDGGILVAFLVAFRWHFWWHFCGETVSFGKRQSKTEGSDLVSVLSHFLPQKVLQINSFLVFVPILYQFFLEWLSFLSQWRFRASGGTR